MKGSAVSRFGWKLVLLFACTSLLILPLPVRSIEGLVCGAVVTQDLTLGAALVCDESHGWGSTPAALIVGASGITVDLNGHTIDRGDSTVLLGILNSGFEDTTVRNGTIVQFNKAVLLDTTSGTTLEGLTLSSTNWNQPASDAIAIAALDTDGLRVASNTIRGNPQKGLLIIGANSLVASNTLISNGTAIHVLGDWNVLQSNSITEGLQGVVVEGDHNTIEDNNITARAWGDDWISVWVYSGSDGNQISSNLIDGGHIGIFVGHNELKQTSHENLISGNTITSSDIAIEISSIATATEVAANQVSQTQLGIKVSGANKTSISGNIVTDSSQDGIVVEAASLGTAITANESHRNGSTDGPCDGIDIRAADTTVANNTANNNAQYGISAVAGVVDGGGNWADGNGSPESQCQNIACQSSAPTTTSAPAATTPPTTVPSTTAPPTTSAHTTTTSTTTTVIDQPTTSLTTTTQPPTSTSGDGEEPAVALGTDDSSGRGDFPWWISLVALGGVAGVIMGAVRLRHRATPPPPASTQS